MTDFELREQRGWAVWRQSSFTGEWRTDGPIFALEMAALSNASDSSIVEEVTIRPVCLGADPVQWAAVQMAMALAWALHVAFVYEAARHGPGYEHNRFTLTLKSEVHELFGGSLEREP